MANLSESISKGSSLRMVYRIKTGAMSASYTSFAVNGKPFYSDDLLSQKDLLPAIDAFMKQDSDNHALGTSCRGIVLVGTPVSQPAIEEQPLQDEQHASAQASPQEGESSPTITPRNINQNNQNNQNNQDTNDTKPNNLWERRKAKAQKELSGPPPLSPPNLSVATTFASDFGEGCSSATSSVHSAVSDMNSAYPPMPHSASSVSSSMSNTIPSTTSPVSSVSSHYSFSALPNNYGNVSPTIVSAVPFACLENNSSTSLASAGSSVRHSDPSSPQTATNFVPLQTFAPPLFDDDLTEQPSRINMSMSASYDQSYNQNNGYWNFSDPSMLSTRAEPKPPADYTLLPHMFPTSVSPQQYQQQYQPPPQLPQQQPQPQPQPQLSQYTVPSTFYLDTSKLHSAGPGQPAIPEVYDMNAMHRLQLMGQQPLPTPGIAYPGAYQHHPHSAPTAFGFKPNERMAAMPNPTGGYFIGPQGAVGMRPGSIRGGKRKSRYGSLGMMGGIGGGYSAHICAECHVVESPEWRKGPKGPKTLCNACGLRWAKKSRKESQKNKAAAAAAAAVATTGPLTDTLKSSISSN